MAGVSTNLKKQRGQDPWALLSIASDPEGTKKRLAELEAAIKQHQEFIDKRGQINRLDAAIARAEAKAKEADEQVKLAEQTAKVIVADAHKEAKQIVAEAAEHKKHLMKSVREAQTRLRDREAELTKREGEIEPLHKAALSVKTEADAKMAEVNRLAETLAKRATALKEAAREALR